MFKNTKREILTRGESLKGKDGLWSSGKVAIRSNLGLIRDLGLEGDSPNATPKLPKSFKKEI